MEQFFCLVTKRGTHDALAELLATASAESLREEDTQPCHRRTLCASSPTVAEACAGEELFWPP